MAFSNQYVLKVDIKKRMSSIVPTFKQGDNGVLKFQVFDDGKKYDLTDYTYSEITFRLPSGQSIVGNPILGLDGILTYNFTGVEMSEVGKIETVLSIYSGSQMVSIQPFTCFIYDSMKGEDLSYIGILQDLIAEVQILKTEIAEAVSGLDGTLEEANRIKNELDGFNTSIKVDEQKRESNESQRILNESTRTTDENSRKSNEVTRGNNDAQRTLNENERKSNESTRQSNESTRQANETTRNNNEEQRQLKFSQIEVTIDQLKAAENFSLATQYKKHNIVTYNGSSFIARKDTISNLPPILPITFNEFWQLLAQRGVDGEGSVKSVNNISPDVNGNVALEIITSWDGIAGKPQTFPPTTHQHTMSDINGLQTALDSKYVKPASGIPLTDMTSAVQASLGKADTAIQTLPSASTTVKGIVQLNNTTNSTSTTLAPTANALKLVNDALTATTNNLNNHAGKIASTTELGHFKPDGTTLTVDPETGVASAKGGALYQENVNIGDTANAFGRFLIAKSLKYANRVVTYSAVDKTITVESTTGISIGDTLFLRNTNNQSESSVKVTNITPTIITVDDSSFFLNSGIQQVYIEGGTSGRQIAEGSNCISSGIGSHAEGSGTISSANFSHAEGVTTLASGDGSHAEGSTTIASGSYSHAEGTNTKAIGTASHAEGSTTRAEGINSHAEGNGSIASGSYSHAEGTNTEASVYASHAQGRFNKIMNGSKTSVTQTDDAFAIGNGSSSARSNAFRVTFDGKTYGLSAFNSTGADYAEFFEWLDGNTKDEDRVGYAVTLDGDKIRKAKVDDDYVLGIISANPSVVGDSYQDDWQNKYVTDEWGRIQYHWIDVTYDETIFVEDENGLNPVIVPKVRRDYLPILNPDWNNEEIYVPREQRKEWDAVGMMGKLYVRDDGTCQINSFAKVWTTDGVLTTSVEPTNMRVIERVAPNIIRVLLK